MKRLQLLILLLAVCILASACEDDGLEISMDSEVNKAKPAGDPFIVKLDDTKKKNEAEETPKEPEKIEILDKQYPYKDVVVPEETRKEIIEKLPKINTRDVNESIKIIQEIRSTKEGQKVLFDIVSDKTHTLRRHASAIIASFCQEAYIPYLRRLIKAEEKDPVVLNNLMQSLGSWLDHKVGLEFIYDIFKTTDSVWMKKNIAHFLSQLNTVPGVFLLIDNASDEDAEVRRECIYSLGQIGWNSSNPQPFKDAMLETLLGAMRDDPVEEVRNEALMALITLQKKEVSSYIVEYFLNKENYYEYRVLAIERISRLADNRFNDAILIQLDDPNWQIRRQSLVSLGILRAEKALTKMLDLYHHDKIPRVRLQAFLSIAGFKDERVKKILLDNLDNPDNMYSVPAVINIIYQEDPSVLPLLVKKFDNEDTEIRYYSYVSVFMMSNQLQDYKYLDEFKRRLEIEDDKDLKQVLNEIISVINRNIEQKLQTQEGAQTQESNESNATEGTEKSEGK